MVERDRPRRHFQLQAMSVSEKKIDLCSSRVAVNAEPTYFHR